MVDRLIPFSCIISDVYFYTYYLMDQPSLTICQTMIYYQYAGPDACKQNRLYILTLLAKYLSVCIHSYILPQISQ